MCQQFPDVASTIDFDESGHQDESEDDIDIPLPDIDFRRRRWNSIGII